MSQKGMHPEDIKAAIRKKGTTLTQLSLDWGFSEATVRNALRFPMPAVDPLIAKFIGKRLCEIWPDRYDEENIRIRPVRKKRLLKKNGSRVTTKKEQCHGSA